MDSDHDLLLSMMGKIDVILSRIEGIPSIEKRVRELELAQSAINSRMDVLDKNTDDLKAKSNTWSVLNSIGVAVAAILSVFLGGK